MKFNWATLIILLILLVWFIQLTKIILSQRKVAWKTCVNFIACICVTLGAIGFFGTALAAAGSLDWLPGSFEWPAGKVDDALIKADGTIIVPIAPLGRIQVYNKKLKFQKGWFIDAGGGDVVLAPADGNQFYAYTARGNNKYLYNTDGTLLKSEVYQSDVYENLPESGSVIKIPTPFYLLIFTSPIKSWGVIVIGFGLFYLTGAHKNLIKKKQNRKEKTL